MQVNCCHRRRLVSPSLLTKNRLADQAVDQRERGGIHPGARGSRRWQCQCQARHCGMMGVMAVPGVLRQRWSGKGGQDVARSAICRLLTGESLDGLPLERHEGRIDLRGLWLVSSRGLPGLRLAGELEGVPAADSGIWADLDFSYATFRIDLAGTTVTNVLFNHVGWQGWRVKASRLTDCSFRAADLRGSSFDGANGRLASDPLRHASSYYQRCDFTRTRTGQRGTWGRAVFEECVFGSTKFESPNWFYGAELRRCIFRGEFREVCFGWGVPADQPAPWLEVDARDATFYSLGIYVHRGPGVNLTAGQLAGVEDSRAGGRSAMP